MTERMLLMRDWDTNSAPPLNPRQDCTFFYARVPARSPVVTLTDSEEYEKRSEASFRLIMKARS